MDEGERSVRIVERDDSTVYIIAENSQAQMEVIADMVLEGERLILHEAHVEGPGAGAMGTRELRAFARASGEQQGVKTVVVHGGRRTTGANPGRRPKALVFEVG